MADPLDPVEALRRIAEGECVTTGTVVRIPCVAERCWPCVARAALAALPAPAPEGVCADCLTGGPFISRTRPLMGPPKTEDPDA